MGKRIWRLVVTLAIGLAIVGAVAIWWNFRAGRVSTPPVISPPTASPTTSPPSATTPPTTSPPVTPPPSGTGLIVTLAKDLVIPWSLAFLPDGSIIFTEREGQIRLIDSKSGLLPNPLLTIPEVAARGEGGLLGIAVHPGFSNNGFVYIYHTYEGGRGLANKVVRLKLEGRQLAFDRVILDDIPAASIHDGGRIKFGPDGYLYITAGDASQSDLAQQLSTLAGKILRVKDDGSIPADNPFSGSPVYSYGHRNPQGLAWDNQGRLWETEHGSSTRDEINLIQPGKNYGWPVVRGDEIAAGMVSPVLHSGDDTWAPSGLAYLPSAGSEQAMGSLYFAGLRGQTLYQAVLKGDKVELKTHLVKDFGRLRDVIAGPDGLLYLFTNNRDGRGLPAGDDDLLIRVDPAQLK